MLNNEKYLIWTAHDSFGLATVSISITQPSLVRWIVFNTRRMTTRAVGFGLRLERYSWIREKLITKRGCQNLQKQGKGSHSIQKVSLKHDKINVNVKYNLNAYSNFHLRLTTVTSEDSLICSNMCAHQFNKKKLTNKNLKPYIAEQMSAHTNNQRRCGQH